MPNERTYNYADSSKQWTAELIVMFTLGFVAASIVWLALWYFQARPAQADQLQAQQTERQQMQQQLEQCTLENQQLKQDNARLEAEVLQLDRQLKSAWLAASRRSRDSSKLNSQMAE